MASTRSTLNSDYSGGLPYRESVTIPPCPVKLDGTNYLVWSRACKFAIGSRGYKGFLTGDTTKPIEAGPSQEKWETTNYLLMSYLTSSMDPDISRGYMLLDTAAAIWKTAETTYSHVGSKAQRYEIRKKIRETTQKKLSVSQYYFTLKALWHELDFYGKYIAACSTDITSYTSWENEIRVYDFLGGLNMDFDQICAHNLSTDPLPSLESAFSIVHSEDIRRSAMHQSPSQERSALYSGNTNQSGGSTDRIHTGKSPVICDYCGKERHTREKCWKLHGRPGAPRKGINKTGSANQITTESCPTDTGFSAEQLNTLRSLISQKDISSSSSTAASAMQFSGPSTSGTVCGSSYASVASTSWIIDSGATDNMTGSSHLITSLITFHYPVLVRLKQLMGAFLLLLGKDLFNVLPCLYLMFFMSQI
ncbi:UBN2_3 domain-containing protein [Cephalotus follicularis]|uniref:UBN2_3 domain-containing protein n=1 Tax=Cephalotus follicularis TaxID=3775 RepID=A0A1Q3B4S0_CEPFO|nr:UBN2_3 domain-containing protein [Cephalotus follicularis]